MANALSRIAYSHQEQADSPPHQLNAIELRISASAKWLDDVRNGYAEDAIVGPVLQYLKDDTEAGTWKLDTKQKRRIKERAKAYLLEEGLLYHKPSGGKLCIPKTMRADVIREAHDAILGSGHIGIAKTAAAVAS